MNLIKRVLSLRALPLLAGFYLAPAATQEVIMRDVARWYDVRFRRQEPVGLALLLLLTERTHEFRNLYYHRLGLVGRLFALVYVPERSLHLQTKHIGPGLYIQHGFATIVSAERIGANCWINQQVTIGHDERLQAPVLQDGVVVSAGALIIGGITVGANAHIAAGAVVVKDVPPGLVARGVPASSFPRGVNSLSHGRVNPAAPDNTLIAWDAHKAMRKTCISCLAGVTADHDYRAA